MTSSLFNDLFVIESDTLDDISSRFYGYSNTGYTNEDSDFALQIENVEDSSSCSNAKSRSGGAWINIDRSSNLIEISQDFFGCYGLYLYQNSDLFMLSNSFQFLAERIATKGLTMTPNTDYLRHFIVSDLCSISFSETPFEEIILLPRNATILIDTDLRSLQIDYVNYEEGSLEIDTAAGIQQLDTWYDKWVSAIYDLIKSGQKVITDLSGGLDSRLVLSLFLHPSIPLEDVQIHTLEDHDHTHVEDYEIASLIAKRFGFELNSHNYYALTPSRPLTLSESFDISLYLKNGFHKQMYWQQSVREMPINQFSGSGGECLRSYWNETPDHFTEKRLFDTYALPTDAVHDYASSFKKILKRSFEEISNHYNLNESSVELTEALYRETRCRFHFGKDLVENYYGGIIKHAPLMDENLYRLKTRSPRCSDDDLLAAVLLDRFAPELLDIPIEGDRAISEQTIEYARQINKEFPLHPKTQFAECRKRETDEQRVIADVPRPNELSPNEFFESITRSIDFKQSFLNFDSSGIFEYQINRYEKRKWQPLSAIYPLAACSNATYLSNAYPPVPISKYFLEMSGSRDAVNLPRKSYPSVLEKLNTAYIEILFETDNPSEVDLELVEGGRVKVRRINATQDDCAYGYALYGHENTLKARFKIPSDAIANILLRGPKHSRKEGPNTPIFCHYTTFKANGDELLSASTNVTYDDYKSFSIDAGSESFLEIELQWTPSLRANRLAARTTDLEKEVKRLKNQLSEIKHSKPFIVGKALTTIPRAIRKRIGR